MSQARRIGGIAVETDKEKIDVWHITLSDEPENGYYDTEMGYIIEMLNECDYGEGYTIKKEEMEITKYHNLPEFTGF